MNVYVIPFSEEELGDKIFSDDPNLSRRRTVILWRTVKEECEKRGVYLHTIDFFKPSGAKMDDVLLVLDHPEENLLWRLYYLWKYRSSMVGFVWKKRRLFYKTLPYFKSKRRILLQLEAPAVAPTAYRILSKLKKLYTEIYFVVDNIYSCCRYIPSVYDLNDRLDRLEMFNEYSRRQKDKYLVMINSNCAPHQIRHQFFGERLRAIKFFSDYLDFDLYGQRWNLMPKHPLWFFRGGFIKKVWRGTIENKFDELSRYKFSLIIENCSYPGYISEKIFDCFITGVVPIYLGAPDINRFIPGDCFIDLRNFNSYSQLDAFLRGFTDKEIFAYRSAAMDFLLRGKDKIFTRKFFAERLAEIFSPQLLILGGNNLPLVSIILPTYNDGKYIHGAVESVIGQTYQNWELIIVDDGSTDNTRDIVHSFSDSRIKYFYQDNRGLASARNLGLKNSKGKYIALLDCDDLFLPGKLETHLAYLENHPECDFSYDELLFIKDDEPGKLWKVTGIKHLSGYLKEEFIRIAGHCIGPSAAFFRRELFEKYGGFPDGWLRNEDYYYWLKLAVHDVYFQHIETTLTLSRLRAQSLSRQGIHLKEAADSNLYIFHWLDKTLLPADPARRYLRDFLFVTQRRLALGYLILKDKKNGLFELKKWKYGKFFAFLFKFFPAGILSAILVYARNMRERQQYKETNWPESAQNLRKKIFCVE